MYCAVMLFTVLYQFFDSPHSTGNVPKDRSHVETVQEVVQVIVQEVVREFDDISDFNFDTVQYCTVL